jgi:hypothetical protein
MIIFPGHQTVYCDVDDTLILWSPSQEQIEKEGIDIHCSESMTLIDGKLVQSSSWATKVVPHKKHIAQIIKHKMRGHQVVVWSAGGADWAAAAVRALQLEKYVDLVIQKPTWCYDDLPPEEYMPKSQWLKDE